MATPVVDTPCIFDASGPLPTPRYERSALATGQRLSGPCIVEDQWSTVVVPPGASLSADQRGHLHLETGVS
jgi:N-methylhydantoinase A